MTRFFFISRIKEVDRLNSCPFYRVTINDTSSDQNNQRKCRILNCLLKNKINVSDGEKKVI